MLDSEDEGRAIVIKLPAGEQLQEHQVHERAWLLVTDGEIEVTTPTASSVTGATGLLAIFDPNERHEVTARPTRACCWCSRPGRARGTQPQQRG